MRRPKPVFTFFCIIDLMSAWYLPGTVMTPALPHWRAGSLIYLPSPGRRHPVRRFDERVQPPMRSGLSSQYQATLDRSYLITGGGLDTWGPLASRMTRRRSPCSCSSAAS